MPERSGFIFSGALHLLVVLAMFFGLPSFLKEKIPEETPIVVELVNLAPETHATRVTQTPPTPKAKPEELAQAEPQPKPEPKPEPPRPTPPAPPPSPPPPPPEPKPQPPEPKTPPPTPTPPPPPPPEPKPLPPEPKPLPKPPEPPPPEPKPIPPKPLEKPQPKPPQKQDDSSFDKLLKTLTNKPQVASNDKPQPRQKAPPQSSPASSQPIAPLGPQLTTSEIDLVKQQLEACWNVPAGAKDAGDLRPEFRVSMNSDGTVRDARLLNPGQTSNPFFQAAADSAHRALLNPRCQPLKLPPDKYDQWQTFTITFDPKDMI